MTIRQCYNTVMESRRGTRGQARRQALVDAAGRIIRSEGPHALSVRRLAEAVGTSTQALYTDFGGKEGVVRAVYLEGFARLTAAMRAVAPSDDPVADLLALGRAYRSAAQASPHLYDIMFGRSIAEFECTDADRAESLDSFVCLIEGVQRALDAGRLAAESAEAVAGHLWIVVHGAVSLELAGYGRPGGSAPDDLDRAYEVTLRRAVSPFLPVGVHLG